MQALDLATKLGEMAGKIDRTAEIQEVLDELEDEDLIKELEEAEEDKANAGTAKATQKAADQDMVIKMEGVDVVTPAGEAIASDVNFTVKKGQALMITGRGGTGKTSFARVIAGLCSLGAAALVALAAGGDLWITTVVSGCRSSANLSPFPVPHKEEVSLPASERWRPLCGVLSPSASISSSRITPGLVTGFSVRSLPCSSRAFATKNSPSEMCPRWCRVTSFRIFSSRWLGGAAPPGKPAPARASARSVPAPGPLPECSRSEVGAALSDCESVFLLLSA